MTDYKCNEKMTLTNEVKIDGVIYKVSANLDVKGECNARESRSWISRDYPDYDCGEFEIDDNSVEIDDAEISEITNITEKLNPDAELSEDVSERVEEYVFDNVQIFKDMILDELINGNIDWIHK